MQSLAPRHRALVRRSFSRVACCHPQIAQCFFDRLFALDPEIERLFPADLSAHRRKLMQMLALLVSALDEPDRFADLTRKLIERHLGYGVQLQHFRLAREALLWALEQNLGSQFTPPVRAAWTAFYEAILDGALSVEGT